MNLKAPLNDLLKDFSEKYKQSGFLQENIAYVCASVVKDSKMSINRYSQQAGLHEGGHVVSTR